MHLKIQPLIIVLLCSAGAGFSQTVRGGFSETYCDHYRCRIHGDHCDERYTVSLIDYPLAEKKEPLEQINKLSDDDPLQARLSKRMAAAGSTNFVRTNTAPFNMAPGLAPKN
ncbi:MAG: hypothetical protein HOO88_07375 [Kiritimatiellaceae bacterium]|nr:hypothetical protein [Kiritimatiellaceae bacterium]